jgi:hydroxypyruvate isomerase
MAGLAQAGADRRTYVANLRFAADAVAADGIELLIEPINGRDMPGYFLGSWDLARSIQDEVGADNLRLQADLYHLQIIRGDLSHLLMQDIARIGHVQIAGVPDRHEPDEGELDYPHLFRLLDRLGYAGWVGCEYRPRGRTEDGLGWIERLG